MTPAQRAARKQQLTDEYGPPVVPLTRSPLAILRDRCQRQLAAADQRIAYLEGQLHTANAENRRVWAKLGEHAKTNRDLLLKRGAAPDCPAIPPTGV